MKEDSHQDGGIKVPYLEELEGWVLDERKVVTFRWLALTLSVTANVAKKMLFDFCERQGADKVWPTYLVMGRRQSGVKEGGCLEVRIVPAEELDSTRKALGTVSSVHVYSVQAKPSARPADLSTQLWATDVDHSKEMVEQSSEAGASLRTHRLSGVRCPSAADVPPPTLPTPPDDVEQESAFPRPSGKSSEGVGAGGAARNASLADEKPKGKAIDPKEFFSAASAATGAGGAARDTKDSGRGKGSEKGGAKKGGGIGSFFSKAWASAAVKQEPKTEEFKDRSKSGLLSSGSSASRAEPSGRREEGGAKTVANGDGKQAGASDHRGKGGVDKEGRSGTPAESAKGRGGLTKRGRPNVLLEDEDEDEDDEGVAGGQDEADGRADREGGKARARGQEEGGSNGSGGGMQGAGQGGDEEGDEEEEWNDDGSAGENGRAPAKTPQTRPASDPSPSQAASGKFPPGSKGIEATRTSRNDDERGADDGAKAASAERSRTNGAAASAEDSRDAPAAKKAKTSKSTPERAGGGDSGHSAGPSGGSGEGSRRGKGGVKTEMGTGRSEDDGDDGQGDAARGGGKGKRRSRNGDGGSKRKGRYDTDDEDDNEGGGDKAPARKSSGAMDKFATRDGLGAGGAPTKRTKTVLKAKMYMDDEGYMRTVNEEVVVTDDDEPAGPPAVRKANPPLSEKKAGDGNRESSAAAGGGEAEGNGTGGAKVSTRKPSTKAADGPKAGAKKGAQKMSRGKQSSMMSFFKKA